MSSSSSTTSSSSWTCPTCTLLNSAEKRRCEACKSRKPPVIIAAQQQEESVVDPTASSRRPESEPASTVNQKGNKKKARTTRSCSTLTHPCNDNDNHQSQDYACLESTDTTATPTPTHTATDTDTDTGTVTADKTDTSTTVMNTTPVLPIMTPKTATTPTKTETPITTKNKNKIAETKYNNSNAVESLSDTSNSPTMEFVSTPNPSPIMVYHHVIAGWHDTHTSSTEIYYDVDHEDTDNKLFPVINPATNQPSLYYQETSEDAFEHALNQANAIQQQYYSKNNNDTDNSNSIDDCEKSLPIIDKAGWWSNPTKSYQRADILMKIAEILGNNTDRLADLEVHQIGRPRKEMRFQLSRLPEWFVYYASLLRVGGCGGSEDTNPPGFGGDHINIVKRVPLGVVAQITPFNHPLLIAVKKLAPALAAGNCCILKPSEQAPASIIELALLCIDAGVPEGVITVLLGGRHVGELLVRDSRIRKVDFTGGPTAGYEIGAATGRNVCQMTQELGGKAPMIVFAPKELLQQKRQQKRLRKSEMSSDIIDIDEYLDPIINGCAFGAFIASGQTCIAGTRLLVQRDIYSLVCEKMTNKIKSFQMGDPFDMNTTFGPLINTKQMDFVHSTVTSCVGGDENNYNLKLLCGGKRYQRFTGNEKYLNAGNWYEPTLVAYSIDDDDDDDDAKITSHDDRKKNITDVHHNCALFQTEIFGPVLGIIPFEDEDHAIQLANDSPYSLGCSIWTHDLVQAHTVSDRVRAGIIWINDHHKNSPASPWGGLTKESGVGRENGREALMEYSQSKSVVIRTKRFDSDWFKDPNARYN